VADRTIEREIRAPEVARADPAQLHLQVAWGDRTGKSLSRAEHFRWGHVLLRDARGIASFPVGVTLDITCSEAATL
jgi:hypothetical protein